TAAEQAKAQAAAEKAAQDLAAAQQAVKNAEAATVAEQAKAQAAAEKAAQDLAAAQQAVKNAEAATAAEQAKAQVAADKAAQDLAAAQQAVKNAEAATAAEQAKAQDAAEKAAQDLAKAQEAVRNAEAATAAEQAKAQKAAEKAAQDLAAAQQAVKNAEAATVAEQAKAQAAAEKAAQDLAAAQQAVKAAEAATAAEQAKAQKAAEKAAQDLVKAQEDIAKLEAELAPLRAKEEAERQKLEAQQRKEAEAIAKRKAYDVSDTTWRTYIYQDGSQPRSTLQQDVNGKNQIYTYLAVNKSDPKIKGKTVEIPQYVELSKYGVNSDKINNINISAKVKQMIAGEEITNEFSQVAALRFVNQKYSTYMDWTITNDGKNLALDSESGFIALPTKISSNLQQANSKATYYGKALSSQGKNGDLRLTADFNRLKLDGGITNRKSYPYGQDERYAVNHDDIPIKTDINIDNSSGILYFGTEYGSLSGNFAGPNAEEVVGKLKQPDGEKIIFGGTKQ
ncbi:hypothetical protein AM202_03927, partial [Actinobacillus minor 202]